jgi:hypothetical protein
MQDDGLISCDMSGVAPGDEALALPGGDTATPVTATGACCRCGGGVWHRNDDPNGAKGISVKTSVLPVPAGGCRNGNVPVSVDDFLVGEILLL